MKAYDSKSIFDEHRTTSRTPMVEKQTVLKIKPKTKHLKPKKKKMNQKKMVFVKKKQTRLMIQACGADLSALKAGSKMKSATKSSGKALWFLWIFRELCGILVSFCGILVSFAIFSEFCCILVSCVVF